MKYIILLVLVVLVQHLFGQKTPSTEQVDAFFNSTTYIVYEGSMFSSYNIYLKDAIDKEWSITPYKVIPYSEFESRINESNTSFLVVTDVQFVKDRTNTTYNFLNLLLGGNYQSVETMPDLVNIPLSLTGQDEERYVYKISALIRFVQNHMNFLKCNPEWCEKEFAKIYNTSRGGFSGRRLYLLQDELENTINSQEELSKNYPFSAEISSREEIELCIESKKKNALFLHIVGPDTPSGNKICFKVLIGADDAEIYYYGYHSVSAKKASRFLKKDLEKIARNN